MTRARQWLGFLRTKIFQFGRPCMTKAGQWKECFTTGEVPLVGATNSRFTPSAKKYLAASLKSSVGHRARFPSQYSHRTLLAVQLHAADAYICLEEIA